MHAHLQGYAAAVLSEESAESLGATSDDLTRLELTVLGHAGLRAVLADTSLPGAARGLILGDLLGDKVGADARRLAVYAASRAPAQEVTHNIAELAQVARVFRDTGEVAVETQTHLNARARVDGFCDALLESLATSEFATVEDELFRWARTVEASRELRGLLLDRDAPLGARLGATRTLLEGRVHPATLRLALYVVEGGRARDLVGTLDHLIDFIARARDWRVARVHTARALGPDASSDLAASLVELHVNVEADLLGGVLVEVGDLRLDATTRGRLSSLRDEVAAG
ncbi:MAG: F0F1 ATP synthase subunit delta, partial [Acidimicrobiales bacterium]